MRFALNYDYPPTHDFSDFFGHFDRLFAAPSRFTPRNSRFATDFFEGDGGFHLQMEVPGTKREEIAIAVEDRVLAVSEGDAERRFGLPDSADAGSVEAKLVDGVLTISIAKTPEAKPRTIAID